ncbi:NUDIX domain-containing protein [Salana multivorans]|uniref:NUDIX domain-containing protein n=1 Tax=Salana multivorans TaxID=120377 RepID=A0A3N2D1J9_9MICO|nr:CoA pyrophosphatase [Salana multivorans]ROR93652.1 NUDIX domain-containing protein [Salana multivorans]
MTAAGWARDDLVALWRRGGWSTALGRPRPGGPTPRRSAVLLLFGLLETSDHADPASADVDLLLTRRSDDLRHHPGQVAFPGGGLDPGEDAVDAAVREAHEETGLDPRGVEPIGPLADVPVTVSGNVVTPVLAWWRVPSALRPDGTETAEVFRVPVPQLVDPANRGTVLGEHAGQRFATPAFTVPDVPLVWGFTAYVLDAVLDALGWAVPWDADRVVPLPRPPGTTP